MKKKNKKYKKIYNNRGGIFDERGINESFKRSYAK